VRVLFLILVGGCLLLFVAQATSQLLLPGPQEDESLHAAFAIDLLRPPFPYQATHTLHVGNLPLPFSINPHTGAFKSYLLWPLFALFGPSVATERYLTIALGFLILLFSYFFLRDAVGEWPAFWALFFLSVDSSFIFYSKLDAGPIMEELFWVILSFWGFARWWKSKKSFTLWVGGLSVFWGVYCHVTFIWVVLAGIVSLQGVFPKALREFFSRKNIPHVIFPILFSVIIFLYWIVGDRTLWITHYPGFQGVFIAFERLSRMGGIAPDILLGKFSKGFPEISFHTRPITDFFVAFSILFLLFRFKNLSKPARLLLVFTLLLFLEIAWTPQGYTIFPTHRMMIFYLFAVFLSGIAYDESFRLIKNFGRKKLLWKGLSLGILFLGLLAAGGQFVFKREVDQKIAETGGRGFWSDRISAVSDILEKERWEKIVCLNWGYQRSLFLLTGGRMNLVGSPVKMGLSQEERGKKLLEAVRSSSPRTLFLMHPEQKWMEDVTAMELKEAAGRSGKSLIRKHFFCDREGKPLYVGYSVSP